MRGDVEHGHLAAEGVEDGGKLAAGGRAAHNRHRARQLLQAPDVAVDQGQLLAGKIQPPGAATRGQDELAGPHLPAIGQGHGVRIHEARLAHVRVDLRARRLQMGAELLLLVDLVDDGLGAGQQLPEVQLRPRHGHAIAGVLAGVAHQAGRARQDARRHAAVVGARPAHGAALDQGNGRAELTAP